MAASGTPPWTAAPGIGVMGATETLHDYLNLGPPNVLDSISADEYARLAQSVAWISSTAALIVMSLTGQESAATEPTIEAYSMTDGYGSYVGDAPTGNFPTVTEVIPGQYQVDFSSSYNDESGAAGGFSMSFGSASAVGTNDTYANVYRVNATRVYILHLDWSSGGSADPDRTSIVEIG